MRRCKRVGIGACEMTGHGALSARFETFMLRLQGVLSTIPENVRRWFPSPPSRSGSAYRKQRMSYIVAADMSQLSRHSCSSKT